jgi:hypothetical protein
LLLLEGESLADHLKELLEGKVERDQEPNELLEQMDSVTSVGPIRVVSVQSSISQ